MCVSVCLRACMLECGQRLISAPGCQKFNTYSRKRQRQREKVSDKTGAQDIFFLKLTALQKRKANLQTK